MAPKRLAAAMGLGLVLLICPPPLGSDNALEIAVRPSVSTAPATLGVDLQIKPHSENRELIVAADSPASYRATHIQLDGERAAPSHAVVWNGLPAGHYKVTVRLRGAAGDRMADSFVVHVVD